MGKYTIHKDGKAGPYLAIEPQDVSTIEKILKNLNILYSKSSSVKDGVETGKVYIRVVNIAHENHTQLQNMLDTYFPE